MNLLNLILHVKFFHEMYNLYNHINIKRIVINNIYCYYYVIKYV